MAFKEILQAKNKKELQKAVENFIRIEDIVEYKFSQFSLQQLAVKLVKAYRHYNIEAVRLHPRLEIELGGISHLVIEEQRSVCGTKITLCEIFDGDRCNAPSRKIYKEGKRFFGIEE